jgi:hypothetical protein
MSSEPSGGWMQPSWRRLVGSTVALFVVILAFLVGRVRAGTDPGLVRETTQAGQQQSAPPLSSPSNGSGVDPQSGQGVDPQSGQGVDPNDPFADPQSGQGFDPGTGSSDDNFGNAIPDQGGGPSDGSGGGQTVEPPSTHVS